MYKTCLSEIIFTPVFSVMCIRPKMRPKWCTNHELINSFWNLLNGFRLLQLHSCTVSNLCLHFFWPRSKTTQCCISFFRTTCRTSTVKKSICCGRRWRCPGRGRPERWWRSPLQPAPKPTNWPKTAALYNSASVPQVSTDPVSGVMP